MTPDTTRRIAQDALDLRQLRRLRAIHQGDVPPGALEESSEAGGAASGMAVRTPVGNPKLRCLPRAQP